VDRHIHFGMRRPEKRKRINAGSNTFLWPAETQLASWQAATWAIRRPGKRVTFGRPPTGTPANRWDSLDAGACISTSQTKNTVTQHVHNPMWVLTL
jgi:hypothetical protein